MTPLKRLQIFARNRHWVVTTAELHELGFTKDAIKWAIHTGRLFRRHVAVFAVGREQLSEEGEALAAVLACGRRAVLSHLSAARLWRILSDAVDRITVSVPTDDGRSGPACVDLRRAATLRPADCTYHRGVPVTTLRRTLIDLAGILDAREMRSVLQRAEQLHSLSLDSLYRSVQTPRRVAKYARLRRTLEEWVPRTDLTESDLEVEFLAFCAKYRLPLPEPQVRFGRYRADFTWPELRLVVETDGWRYHRGAVAQGNDAVKERYIRAQGYSVERFTWAEIVNRPAEAARELRAIIERRRTTGGVSGA